MSGLHFGRHSRIGSQALGLIYLAAYVFVELLVSIAQGDFPGLNLINTTIFIASGLLFIPSFMQADRTMALTELRRSGTSEFYVFSNSFSGNRNGSKDTWAGINNKSYRIAFYGLEQGHKNCKEVLNTMKNSYRIIWIRPGTWALIAFVIFVLNLMFYKNIFPLYENMNLDDTAIKLLDGFIFYLPSVLALGCPVLSFVFVIVRDNILYKCAERLSSEIMAEMSVQNGPGKKWYHNICPKCGARSSSSLKHCISCGNSLEVMESDTNLYSIRYISDELD